MRQKLQDYILLVHQKYQLTTFMVSHDLPEIFKMADQVIQIDQGKVVGQDSPEALFASQTINGNYKSIGTVLAISLNTDDPAVKVLVDQTMVVIKTDLSTLQSLNIGDQVMVVAETFEPKVVRL